MRDTRARDRAAFFLLGAAIGAAAALPMTPASGAHTRRRLRRQGEEVADYLSTQVRSWWTSVRIFTSAAGK
jgi:gas vesicle protein